ncbi:MAG: glycosyltransferase family 87 protein [Dehalococcoidia bacterium]
MEVTTEALAPPANRTPSRLGRALNAAIELDFTQPIAFVAMAIAYIASRAPFLNLGYGTDPDAWRVGLTAHYIWENGEYLPSRLPGYPLHEFVTTALYKGGWVATNLSTVLISLAGVYLFAALAKKLDLPNRGALTLGFAFTPLLWINSVMTMDYMWALTLILGAYLALLNRSPVLAGILLGLAGGFRLTSLAMLVPFALLLWRTDRRHEIRPVALTSVALTLLAFVPVLMDYGLNFLNFYDQPVPVAEFFRALGKDALGIVGVIAVLVAVVVSLPRLRAFPKDLARDANVLVWVAVPVIYVATYSRLPHEIAYLIPIFPFAYFLLARYLSRPVLVALLAVVVLSGFVDITSPEDEGEVGSKTFTSAGIGRGMVLSDVDTLHNQRAFADEIWALHKGRDPSQPAVVITGFIYPQLVMRHKDDLDIGIFEKDIEAISQLSDKGVATDRAANVQYFWLLEYDAFQELKESGKAIYFTGDAATSTYHVYGYRPAYFGATKLALTRENPSLGGGAASTDR